MELNKENIERIIRKYEPSIAAKMMESFINVELAIKEEEGVLRRIEAEIDMIKKERESLSEFKKKTF